MLNIRLLSSFLSCLRTKHSEAILAHLTLQPITCNAQPSLLHSLQWVLAFGMYYERGLIYFLRAFVIIVQALSVITCQPAEAQL